MRRRLAPLLLATGALCAAVAVPAAPLEGIGRDMGYRLFGDAKKNKPVLLQNSRPHPVQYFDESRGVFVAVPAYSDVEVPCRGQARKLNVRYRDAFREEAPFQLVVACGREVQFIAPQQVAPPRPVEMPAAAPPAGAPAGAEPVVAEPAPADPAAGPDIIVTPLAPAAAGAEAPVGE